MVLLRSPLFWVLISGLAVLAAFIFRRSHGKKAWGFKDVVKNPDYWDAVSDEGQKVEQDKQRAQNWNSDQVARAVRHFVFDVKTGNNAWGERKVLKSLGARKIPAILDIVKDVSLRAKLTMPTGTDLLPEAPINRLCDLLDEHPPAEVIDLLAPFLDDSSAEVRKSVALVLGSVGTPAVVNPSRKALSDMDEYVRSYALMGLERALKGNSLDEQCKRDLFADLTQLLGEDKNADSAAGLLLDFDQNRATEFYLSPSFFAATSKSLHEALEAFAVRKISVPRDRLLALIKELEESKLEYPQTYSLGEALRLLGQHQQAEDIAFLEARLTNAEERVAEGAAAGLLTARDLEGFRQRLWDKEKAEGFSALSIPQKYFSAVTDLDGEVNNGGHSQYFVNSSGDRWREAIAGLEVMGFKERAAIFREAVAKFGISGPSANRKMRQEELARLARQNDALFDSLDSRYYKCTEVVEVLGTRYVIENETAFK